MIFSQDRATLRRMYRDAWRRARSGEILGPLDAQIARVVEEHPEYQALVESGELGSDYLPEDGAANPFLHMGMHLAIREQVNTDRPAGVRAVHSALAAREGGPLEAEHVMMDVLGETLWEAQRSGRAPDERTYLERLNSLV